MTRRGRPGKGLGHVDPIDASEATKVRLKWILKTLNGEATVKEASEALEVSEARFAVLREQALSGALDALEPRPPGRPPTKDEETAEVKRLRRENRELLLELQAAWTRTELALTMPHVLRERPEAEADEKGGPRARRRRKPPWFGDRANDTEGRSSG